MISCIVLMVIICDVVLQYVDAGICGLHMLW